MLHLDTRHCDGLPRKPVFFSTSTGYQWRALPRDLRDRQSVHGYFKTWQEVDDEGKSLLQRAS